MKYRWHLAGCIVIFQAFTLVTVYHRQVSIVSFVSWIGSIVTTYYLLCPRGPESKNRFIERKDWIYIVILCTIGLGLLWYFSAVTSHYHQDEFITAYTSWSLPGLTSIDWFAAYPPVWVSQFPIVFHILQKPFFLILGPTLNAIRISVWPYVILITFALYGTAKTLFSRKTAVVALFVYVFFAPHLYLSSMGLHFVSSTAFLNLMLMELARFIETKQTRRALLAGIWSGLSYLTYTSSYVAYPVLCSVLIVSFLIIRKKYILDGLTKATIVTAMVLAPFLVYALRVNNFFGQRVDQVNIFWGSWQDNTSAGPVLNRILTHGFDAIGALYQPGVGGLGGYNFGKLGLLDPFSLSLILLGILFLVILAVRKQWQSWFILIALGIPFVSGYILTTHPPPFHRLSIVYPTLALCIALGIDRITKHGKRYYLLLTLLSLTIILGFTHAREMILADARIYPQNSRVIGDYLNNHTQEQQAIMIASYPSFYLGQELLFRTNNHLELISDDTEKILKQYSGGTLILLQPSMETKTLLQDRFPSYRFITNLGGTSLGDLALFVPK
ncbi:hypothetical protein A2875_00420 [Candidatus Gottesmanbacteria bacterium RIFCSPHIGHO2_01_FULL_46_14]|uniref:Glycosyltransferase RgtA/B/C/D-like domain-containing protein n=1 Tax=Candidatus Gottesmanbacteria bacterium RIFCSPHIGHO2_01_FULL_46_14 TaxID=1798380 RepID=A0A1F5ZMQ6_9BACT|nr:MAG: hypothetical protein A2875_00420 [Candidatus Gottesmanbacteria bacterium RIFCSPHIGHO2_01_FULL_46_14]